MRDADTESTLEESAEWLVERAGKAGHPITRDQLVRWHRADLLPRPRQVSRGRQGSEIYYPPGTATQLLDLLKLKERYRPLASIRWGLWWLGYPIPDHWAREFIEKQSREMLKTYGELITPDGQLTEKANAVLDKAPTAEIGAGTMRRARRRVGVEDFDFFIQDLLLVGSGNVGMVKDEDLELLERGMAMDRARTDKLASIGGPWLTTNIREDFTNISKLNDPKLHLAVLAKTSDAELRAVRDTAKPFLAVITNLGDVVRPTVGPSAFGYGAFGKVFDEVGDMPNGQALICVVLLASMAEGFAGGISETVARSEAAALLPAKREILIALREAVPELAPVISDRRLGAAIKDAKKQEQLQNDIAEARIGLEFEIDAFFAAHPEYHEILRPGTTPAG